MMTQRAIERAVAGGWKKETLLNGIDLQSGLDIRDAVLDPAFWRALGKTEGWGEKTVLIPHWRTAMHEMMDHLANGGTVESFFASL